MWLGRHWHMGRCALTTQVALVGSHGTRGHGSVQRPPKQAVVSVQSVSTVQTCSDKNSGVGERGEKHRAEKNTLIIYKYVQI